MGHRYSAFEDAHSRHVPSRYVTTAGLGLTAWASTLSMRLRTMLIWLSSFTSEQVYPPSLGAITLCLSWIRRLEGRQHGGTGVSALPMLQELADDCRSECWLVGNCGGAVLCPSDNKALKMKTKLKERPHIIN